MLGSGFPGWCYIVCSGIGVVVLGALTVLSILAERPGRRVWTRIFPPLFCLWIVQIVAVCGGDNPVYAWGVALPITGILAWSLLPRPSQASA